MVTDRLKKICTRAVEDKYPQLKIVDFEVRKTYKYDGKTENWVDDSYAVFIQVEVPMNGFGLRQLHDVEMYLNALLGFEFCIDISWN